MNTYLLAWNPKRWNWTDLAEMSEAVRMGTPTSGGWSCGNSKHIQPGDRVFLIRLGKEPKGIMASGTVTKGSQEDLHWDPEKAALGRTTQRVQLRFDSLLNPDIDPILPLELLRTPPLAAMHWTPQISGVRIPEPVAAELENTWLGFSGLLPGLPEEVQEADAIYEGATRRILVNAYERNPEARRRCIAHYGPVCAACGFNFEERYGIIGRDFIHVHHLKQLSDIGQEYQIDPVRDLMPVCPNCHAIIHRRQPPYTVDDVRGFLHSRS